MSQYWAIYKNVDFVQLLSALPTFARFLPFRDKMAFLQKNYNIALNFLWYSIFMQKNIKNG